MTNQTRNAVFEAFEDVIKSDEDFELLEKRFLKIGKKKLPKSSTPEEIAAGAEKYADNKKRERQDREDPKGAPLRRTQARTNSLETSNTKTDRIIDAPGQAKDKTVAGTKKVGRGIKSLGGLTSRLAQAGANRTTSGATGAYGKAKDVKEEGTRRAGAMAQAARGNRTDGTNSKPNVTDHSKGRSKVSSMARLRGEWAAADSQAARDAAPRTVELSPTGTRAPKKSGSFTDTRKPTGGNISGPGETPRPTTQVSKAVWEAFEEAGFDIEKAKRTKEQQAAGLKATTGDWDSRMEESWDDSSIAGHGPVMDDAAHKNRDRQIARNNQESNLRGGVSKVSPKEKLKATRDYEKKKKEFEASTQAELPW